MAYCLKNIKRCEACGLPCHGQVGLDAHREKQSGTFHGIKQAIEAMDVDLLRNMEVHSSLSALNEKFLSSEVDNQCLNSMAHHAILSFTEVPKLKQMFDLCYSGKKPINVNTQNKQGETVLHLVCKRAQQH